MIYTSYVQCTYFCTHYYSLLWTDPLLPSISTLYGGWYAIDRPVAHYYYVNAAVPQLDLRTNYSSDHIQMLQLGSQIVDTCPFVQLST